VSSAAAIRSAAEIPSSTGIFTSRTTRSGRCCSASRTRVLAVPGLAHDVEPGITEHLDDVEADQRLVDPLLDDAG
jgi:hypothetical protein